MKDLCQNIEKLYSTLFLRVIIFLSLIILIFIFIFYLIVEY